MSSRVILLVVVVVVVVLDVDVDVYFTQIIINFSQA